MKNKLTIYTDGSYASSTNTGGVGFVVVKEDKPIFSYSKMFRNTTNQRMEVLAVLMEV